MLDRAVDRLMSLSEGDRGVLDVVACGRQAVPRLRALLFQREPSGLFQPRCRVVEALALLGAYDVLIEFFVADRTIADPVERAGEDAVLNATARALHDVADETIISRLLSLAETRRLAGPIEVLGALRRVEALPCLVAALADDVARPAAEDAIRQFGHDAAPALIAASTERTPQDGSESESSRRRRRAALALLTEIGDPVATSGQQRSEWINDYDAQIAVEGCRMALRSGDPVERQVAIRRLIDLLPTAPWHVQRDIEERLVEHAADARPLVRDRARAAAPAEGDFSAKADGQRRLNRIAHRLES
jgi:hypothetical protein